MYLANDVIQNSRKKGPEFSQEFAKVLEQAIEKVVAEADDKTLSGVERILTVWADRKIYNETQISKFLVPLNNRKAVNKSNRIEESARNGDKTNSLQDSDSKKRSADGGNDDESSPFKKPKPTDDNKPDTQKQILFYGERTTDQNSSGDGNRQRSCTDSTVTSPDNLVKALISLQSKPQPSADQKLRDRISKFPPEVTDINLVNKIKDKAEIQKLSQQVDEAFKLISTYNQQLRDELDERNKLAKTLEEFIESQRRSLRDSEEQLNAYKAKLELVTKVKQELISLPQ